MLAPHALKGQKLLAQGIALGNHGRKFVALKGQKLSSTRQFTKLLPLQGALLTAIIPRAMPWAKSFWAFSPYLNHVRKFSKLLIVNYKLEIDDFSRRTESRVWR